MNGNVDVFQWHEDMFALPDDATLLAISRACPYQAFRVGSCAYGLQFHVEITDKSIQDWSESYFKKDDSILIEKMLEMLKDYQKKRNNFNNTAEVIYANFLKIMQTNVGLKRESGV